MPLHPRAALPALIAAVLALACPTPAVAQGWLCVEGGGSFGDGQWAPEVADWCVARAPSNPDVLILGLFGSDSGLQGAFLGAGAGSVSNLNPTAALADQASTFNAILAADIVWIRDNVQSSLLANWEGTLVEQALQLHYFDGGVLGASGGAAILLGEFVFDRANGPFDPRDALEDAHTPQLSLRHDWLGIAPTLLFDEDLTDEGRLPRLALMVGRANEDFGADALGVGLDDRTALGIEPDGKAIVLGEGAVTMLHTLPESRLELEPGQPPAITDLRQLQLVAGYEVDLITRTVLARPAHAVLWGPPLSRPIFGNFNVNGSIDAHSSFGDVELDFPLGFESLKLGGLSILDGDNMLLRTVVATRTWFDPVAHEIKVGGVHYALSQNPHYLGILLDDDVRIRVTTDDTLIVNPPAGVSRAAVLIDTYDVTSTAVSTAISEPGSSVGPRQSVALDDARLHLLRPGDGYDSRTQAPILPDSQWLDVGQGLGGSNGVPTLGGHGTLVAFNNLLAQLEDGEPFSVGFLVIGFGLSGAPLKQGTLVPNPDFISNALPLDAAGGLQIPFFWPADVPEGFDIFTQFWIQDPGAPAGYSASNGLVVMPP